MIEHPTILGWLILAIGTLAVITAADQFGWTQWLANVLAAGVGVTLVFSGIRMFPPIYWFRARRRKPD